MSWTVYLLRCADETLYCGCTNNLQKRLKAHNSGQGAKYTRAHNDANVLCMGERVVGAGLAIELADVFWDTPFEGGRHARRVGQLADLEGGERAPATK